MDAMEEIKTDLAALQAVVGRRNILFARRVRLETKQDRIAVITPSKVYFLAVKAPHKVDSSFHLLDVKGIESKKPLQLTLAVHNDKKLILHIKVAHHEDIDQIAAHILSQLKLNFPLSNVSKTVILSISPSDRQQKIESLAENFVNALLDTDIGPCGGFSLSYLCLCDYYGQHSLAEVVWDIDKIYGSHQCQAFDVADFDHLEQRELLPIIATLEYNTWFTELKCKSLKLSSEVIDVIAKILKTSQSLEGLTLPGVHLSREQVQKFSTALISNPDTSLKILDLSHNNLEDRGVGHLCGAIASVPHGFETIKLASVGMTNKGSVTLSNSLKTNKFIPLTLTKLNISGNILKMDGTQVLCDFLANPNVLRHLDISNTECGLDMLFGAMLRGCTQHLQHFDASSNPFSHKRSKELQIPPSLQQFFKGSLAIKVVNLSSTKIPAEAVKAILLGLLGNAAVADVSFDLSKNELRSSGANEIASCIGNIKNISHLDLTDNGMDYDIVNLCISMQKNNSVKHLALGQNFIKARNVSPVMEAIVDLISRDSGGIESISLAESRLKQEALAFIDALGTNTSLLEIDLRANHIGDEGARLLAKALQINTTLRKIQLDRNGITHKGFQDIATALKRNYSLHCIPMPTVDIAQCMKHFSEATSKALAEIEKLLLRNQSPHRFNPEQSHQLQQSLLLSSIDQNSTDEVVVALQNLIYKLDDSDDDQVQKEISVARKAINDSDHLKEALMHLYLHTDGANEKVKLELSSVASGLNAYVNNSLKIAFMSMISKASESCPIALAEADTQHQLKVQLEEKAVIDSKIVDDAILRLGGTQIVSNVCKSSLVAATILGNQLTENVLFNLRTSHANLTLLDREQKESKRKRNDSGGRRNTSANEDLSVAARKARNRLSKVHQRSSMLVTADQAPSSGKNLMRRPTFHRKPPTKEEISVEIDLDDKNESRTVLTPSSNHAPIKKTDSNDPLWSMDVAPSLNHLSKNRARPARGRKPPSRVSNLAHMNPDADGSDSVDGLSDSASELLDEPTTIEKVEEKPAAPAKSKSNSLPPASSSAVSPKPAPRPKPPEKKESTKKTKNPLGGIGLPNFLKKKGRSSSQLKDHDDFEVVPSHTASVEELPVKKEEPRISTPTEPDPIFDNTSITVTASTEKAKEPESKPPDVTQKPVEALPDLGERKASTLSRAESPSTPESSPIPRTSSAGEHGSSRPVPARRLPGMTGGIGLGGDIMQEMKLKQNKGKVSPELAKRPSPPVKPGKPKPILPKKPPSIKRPGADAPVEESKSQITTIPEPAKRKSMASASSEEELDKVPRAAPRRSSLDSEVNIKAEKPRKPSEDSQTEIPKAEPDKTIDEELTEALFGDEDDDDDDDNYEHITNELDEEEQLNLRLASYSKGSHESML